MIMMTRAGKDGKSYYTVKDGKSRQRMARAIKGWQELLKDGKSYYCVKDGKSCQRMAWKFDMQQVRSIANSRCMSYDSYPCGAV
jgi:hypothetical protein